jgi:tRNA dimethylallyltransferase
MLSAELRRHLEAAPLRPVLIAGATASGKSALAAAIVRDHGGLIVNADASQVYACWRVLTARPSEAEERALPHALYGMVAPGQPWSAGHWLRAVRPLLAGPHRPVIVGGTGLYFRALTEGLADIPPVPPDLRAQADAMPLDALVAGLDPATARRIDLQNRARVQRAWEVRAATGRGLAEWQEGTQAPLLPLSRTWPLVLLPPVPWLDARIARRFEAMLADGALDEVRALLPVWDPAQPWARAIGAPELAAFLRGEIDLDQARSAAILATRQYAKRQRTWFRARMADWQRIDPSLGLSTGSSTD